jgi:hypothetical protein
VSQVELKFIAFPEHPSLSPVYSSIRIARSFMFCAVFCPPRVCLSVLFLLIIVVSVLLLIIVVSVLAPSTCEDNRLEIKIT